MEVMLEPLLSQAPAHHKAQLLTSSHPDEVKVLQYASSAILYLGGG